MVAGRRSYVAVKDAQSFVSGTGNAGKSELLLLSLKPQPGRPQTCSRGLAQALWQSRPYFRQRLCRGEAGSTTIHERSASNEGVN